MMTRVKICGITNAEDAAAAVRLGADELGFNFYAKSSRYVTPEVARSIIDGLPDGIGKVGVFVNESLGAVLDIADETSLDAVQLHGDESPEFIGRLMENNNAFIIKALRVSPGFLPESVKNYPADAILLDAYSRQEFGGTGEVFDWTIARKVREIVPKLYLAGGLSGSNVAEAIVEVRPYCVDACSCLESRPGKKDEYKIKAFLEHARKAL